MLAVGTGHAHLLNMTHISLQPETDEVGRLTIEIDLGQSLMTPEQYWQAVSAPARATQQTLVRDAITQLQQGVVVNVDGQAVPLALHDWSLQAVSAEAVTNPLTPQMARVEFRLPLRAGQRLEVVLDEALSVPWPCLLRVDLPNSVTPLSRLLTADTRSSRSFSFAQASRKERTNWLLQLTEAYQSWVPGLTWVAVGFQHIIPDGLDHILFILGLFFLAARTSGLLLQVTCFTLAHSVTLALAMLDIIVIEPAIVEPLIAASIVYIAFDNLLSERVARWRLGVVTLFGLLHGVGFASALSSLALPQTSFFASLMLFNIGVELGQICVLLIAALTVGWFRGWSKYVANVARPASITIAGVGMYWLVKRLAF